SALYTLSLHDALPIFFDSCPLTGHVQLGTERGVLIISLLLDNRRVHRRGHFRPSRTADVGPPQTLDSMPEARYVVLGKMTLLKRIGIVRGEISPVHLATPTRDGATTLLPGALLPSRPAAVYQRGSDRILGRRCQPLRLRREQPSAVR